MTGLWALFITWMCISFVAGIYLAINHILGTLLWELFWLPNKLSKEWCEENSLNKIGQCIIDIWFNIIMFPAMALAIVIIGLFYTFAIPTMFFAWVSRNK